MRFLVVGNENMKITFVKRQLSSSLNRQIFYSSFSVRLLAV